MAATLDGLRQADAEVRLGTEVEVLTWWPPDGSLEKEPVCLACGVPSVVCTPPNDDTADATDFAGPGWSKFDADLAEAGGSITALFEKDMADPNWPHPPGRDEGGAWGMQIDRAIFAKWDSDDYQRVLAALARQRYAIYAARERADAQEAQALARTVQAEPVETPPPDWLREATDCVLTAAPPAGERGLVA